VALLHEAEVEVCIGPVRLSRSHLEIRAGRRVEIAEPRMGVAEPEPGTRVALGPCGDRAFEQGDGLRKVAQAIGDDGAQMKRRRVIGRVGERGIGERGRVVKRALLQQLANARVGQRFAGRSSDSVKCINRRRASGSRVGGYRRSNAMRTGSSTSLTESAGCHSSRGSP